MTPILDPLILLPYSKSFLRLAPVTTPAGTISKTPIMYVVYVCLWKSVKLKRTWWNEKGFLNPALYL
jgi:hypothetical protein